MKLELFFINSASTENTKEKAIMRTNKTRIKRQKRRTGFFRKRILFFAVLAVLTTFGTYNGIGQVSAHDGKSEDLSARRYYKSIEVQAGDTLWDIAELYIDEQRYSSVNEYINELIEINQLGSSRIHEGRYLTVVYWL